MYKVSEFREIHVEAKAKASLKTKKISVKVGKKKEYIDQE